MYTQQLMKAKNEIEPESETSATVPEIPEIP